LAIDPHEAAPSVLFVGLLIAVAAFAAINPRILGLFHDDGIYAVAAKALADGDGYRIISLPGDPARQSIRSFIPRSCP